MRFFVTTSDNHYGHKETVVDPKLGVLYDMERIEGWDEEWGCQFYVHTVDFNTLNRFMEFIDNSKYDVMLCGLGCDYFSPSDIRYPLVSMLPVIEIQVGYKNGRL